MLIKRSIDIEDEIRKVLSGHLTTYCRPLPKDFEIPSITISLTGGTRANEIDTFTVRLDSRAKHEAKALEILNDAIGILQVKAGNSNALRHIEINSIGTWGADPVRPELAMCTASLNVVAHIETKEV